MVSIETIQLLITVAGPVGFLLSWLLLKSCRNLIESMMLRTVSKAKNKFVAEMVQNPELIEQLLTPVVQKFAAQLMKNAGAAPGRSAKITGNRFVDGLIESFGGPILEKMAQKALGGAENASSSPFG